MAGNEEGGIGNLIDSRPVHKCKEVEGLALVTVTCHRFFHLSNLSNSLLTAFDCRVVNNLLLPEASSLPLLPRACDTASTVPAAFLHPTPPRLSCVQERQRPAGAASCLWGAAGRHSSVGASD